ncbi:MAG: hypothetical protein ACOZBL_01580 [Patescibacteria group bacterium]
MKIISTFFLQSIQFNKISICQPFIDIKFDNSLFFDYNFLRIYKNKNTNMNTQQCQNLIRETIRQELIINKKNKDQIAIPALIKQAWGSDAKDCYEQIGNYI